MGRVRTPILRRRLDVGLVPGRTPAVGEPGPSASPSLRAGDGGDSGMPVAKHPQIPGMGCIHAPDHAA